MNRILYYILLVFVTGMISFFMMISSLSFADVDNTVVLTTQKDSWYTIALKKTPTGTDVEYSEYDEKKWLVPSNTIVFWELGRLASFMYLSESGSTFPPLTLSGKTTIQLSDTQGILSLYDLFTNYTILSEKWEYKLDQITNGSFYIGKESDGRIALYAIDGVVRLTFLDKWVEMTNMMLFPGSYIRFDPKRNASLKGADLFRTILSLQEGENEIFEFVNPRVNTGDDKDTFFNYRLPLQTKSLFRTLSARFHDQVEWVDILKSYATDINFAPENLESNWLKNPSKKNHLMLLELKYLLSQILRTKEKSTDGQDVNIRRIGEIYKNALSLKMESSTAKKTIEQFLLDGRFALYGNTTGMGQWYQETYMEIARIIGIEPAEGKSLFQNLADIYSGNLFLQMSKTSTFKIDTYEPTATTLRSTIEEEGILQKDFFDIAIYTYNILEKVQDQGILSIDYLLNISTYDYLMTFFTAWSRYMESIEDIQKRTKTILSFSSQFYERILTMTVRSLYRGMMREDGGALYLSESLLNGTEVKLNPDIIRQITQLNGVVEYMNRTVKWAYDLAGDDTDVYLKIQKATIRLNALSAILDVDQTNEKYSEYTNVPYAVEIEEDIALPRINPDTFLIEKFARPPETNSNPGNPLINKKVESARSLFPDADISSFIPDGEYLRVTNALGYMKKTDGSVAEGYWSVTFLDESNISQILLQYAGRVSEIKFQNENIDVETFRLLQTETLKPYLDIIESNSDVVWNVRILIGLKRVDIGEQSLRILE
jgi:hypothetical protein